MFIKFKSIISMGLTTLLAGCQAAPDMEQQIDELYGKYPVQTLCDAFNIPTATYYNHRLRNKNEDA